MKGVKPYVLSLFLSNRYSYAQIMHRPEGRIVAAASSLEKSLREELPSTSDQEASRKVGQLLAERALEAGVPAVHWARKHGQRYHGKIKELLQSMTEAGLPLS